MKPSTLRVLGMLDAAGDRGVTSGEFAREYVLRYAARIAELRAIPGVKVTAEKEPESSQWRYRLVRGSCEHGVSGPTHCSKCEALGYGWEPAVRA